MIWRTHSWPEMTRDALHAVLRLRTDVFVVEQDCPYPELDGKDLVSTHVLALSSEESAAEGAPALACARVVWEEGKAPSIGRVAVDAMHRGRGLGQTLMRHTLHATTERAPGQPIRISAQSHLQGFYAAFGFVGRGDEYLEDGIPHRAMWRAPDPLESAEVALRHELKTLEELTFVPESSQWGTARTVRHLTMVASGVATALSHWNLDKAVVLTPDHALAAGELIGALASPAKFEVPPGFSLPDESEPFTSQDFEALHQATSTLLERARAMPPEARSGHSAFRHPVAGPLSLVDTLHFVVFHTLHHRRILKSREGNA